MSCLNDTDFLIHSIRLAYLQNVDDPYGPRIITSDPSSNPYVLEASLANKWPVTTSPHLSEDEVEHLSGMSGAKLKHSQTIMGRRAGGFGLRVHAKRDSTSKRMSGVLQEELKNFVPSNDPMRSNSTLTATSTSLARPTLQVQEATMHNAVEAPVTKAVQFVPKFKGAAEMEARRRIRLAARRGLPQTQIRPESSSSSSEEDLAPMADTDSIDSDFVDDNSLEDGDDFDPDFVNPNTPNVEASSDFSTGQSLPSVSPAPVQSRRVRLSPVVEGGAGHAETTKRFVRKQASAAHMRSSNSSSGLAPLSSSAQLSSSAPGAITFSRRKVLPIKQQKSALTTLLASSTSSNPFSETYATISGRGESASTDVLVYFPHATSPAGKGMELNVRKDSTIEEVLGFALLNYWEEGWLPKLDEGLKGEDDPNRLIKLSAVGWIMRIAEEDGEVDDDFPPPDRMGKVSRFHADAFAVLEATPAQIAQNEILEVKIQRSPSRSAVKKKASMPNLSAATAPGIMSVSTALASSTLLSTSLSASLGPSTSGPPIFLRVRVADTADADSVHFSTTIPVSAGMYMQEALELVCRKKNLSDPKNYTLMLAELPIVIPLDRTVASLQGKRELVLVKKSMLGDNVLNAAGKTTDPNASIFKRISDTPEVKLSSALDYMSSYKKYTIYRKMPMMVARQERTLAIDGVYIHIMPSNKAKAVFDSGKTWSYHIKSIDCQQSAKSSSIFRLVLHRAGGMKRYDFEAENPKLAGEIVQTVKNLKAALERTGTIKNSRRSRQVN